MSYLSRETTIYSDYNLELIEILVKQTLIQCHGNFIEVEKLQLLEIDISRNYSYKVLGVLRGDLI